MKIDVTTVNVLKNFAKINQAIIVQEGNVLKTASPIRTIAAKATVKTEFNHRFAVYNLNQFIALLSTFNDPDLSFDDKAVTISEENRVSKFVYADEDVIKIMDPEKEITIPDVYVSFRLTEKDLRDIEKASGILELPEIAVVGDGSKLTICATDTSNPTCNDFSIVLGETDKVFKAIFKVENFKMISGDYNVEISSKKISHFSGNDIEYFIVVEKKSTF